jgi:uridine kinase
MRGDILIIGDHHLKAAQEVLDLVLPEIRLKEGTYIMTVSGESGAGKSELAYALEGMLEKEYISARIIQQDDYFVYPPKTNERKREEDIGRIGPGEVRLDLLDENVRSIKAGKFLVDKPLVIFGEDRITTETVDLSPFSVILIDGTYTTLLHGIDCRIFIDRDNNDTRADRLKRNREKQNDYLEQILEIEHGIISRHKEKADIIVTKEFNAYRTK